MEKHPAMTWVINGCSGSNSRAGQIRGAACKQLCHPTSELACNTLIFPRLGQLLSKGCPSCQTAQRSRQTLIRVEPTKPTLKGHLDHSKARLQHQPEPSAQSRRNCITTSRSQSFVVPWEKNPSPGEKPSPPLQPCLQHAPPTMASPTAH